MAATSKPSSKSSAKSAPKRRTRRTGGRDPLAISLLKKDHREVEGWFDEYEQLDDEVDGRRDQQCTLGEQQNGEQNEQRIPGIVHLRVIRCTHSVVPYKTIDLHLPV